MARRFGKMVGRLMLVLPSVLVAAAIFWSNVAWQQANLVSIRGTDVFRATLNARPRTLAGLSALGVDLFAPDGRKGEIVFRLRRFSLGSTNGSYRWDWKTGPYQSANISFIDLSKRIGQDSAVEAWDVDVATSSSLRLKAWRDVGSQWVVVGQSEMMTATVGLNHFTIDSPLPVRQGDYIGLYASAGSLKLISPSAFSMHGDLTNQDPSNLRESAFRGLQYNFLNDVTCGLKAKALPSPNPGYSFKVYLAPSRAQESLGSVVGHNSGVSGTQPITVIDLGKVASHSGLLTTWEAVIGGSGSAKLKIWRKEGGQWIVVAESRVEPVSAGLNRFSLVPPLEISQGDYLGYYSDQGAGEFLAQTDECGTLNQGKLYLLGIDFTGRLPETSLTRDTSGGYKFSASYSPPGPEKELVATLPLLPQRATYRIGLPTQMFAVDEQVQLSIEARNGADVSLYPSLQNLLGRGGAHVGLEYGSPRFFSSPGSIFREQPSP